MEKVDIQAIGTFIDDRFKIIKNELNIIDITYRSTSELDVNLSFCKYPIKISKVITFNKSYDFDHDTQPIEIKIPVVDINCTPIKINSVNVGEQIHHNGYQILDLNQGYYKIMINTFNNIIKHLEFDTVFYVNFINFDVVNKIGFYNKSDYFINPEIKSYFQLAFNYLKEEYNLTFNPNKSYLFLDINHNEIIIYKNNVIYRYTNIHVERYEPLLQKYIFSPINCFEEFVINENVIKSDDQEDISDDEQCCYNDTVYPDVDY